MRISAAVFFMLMPVSTMFLFRYVKYASVEDVNAMVIKKPSTHFQCGLSNCTIRLNTAPVNCDVYSSSSSSINSSDIFHSPVEAKHPARRQCCFAPTKSIDTRYFHFQFFVDPRLDIIDPAVHAIFIGNQFFVHSCLDDF